MSLVFPHRSHREHVFSFTTNTLPGTASAISTYLLGPFSHTLDIEENIKQVFSFLPEEHCPWPSSALLPLSVQTASPS